MKIKEYLVLTHLVILLFCGKQGQMVQTLMTVVGIIVFLMLITLNYIECPCGLDERLVQVVEHFILEQMVGDNVYLDFLILVKNVIHIGIVEELDH
jgi:flagellar biosynthesis component FlhA